VLEASTQVLWPLHSSKVCGTSCILVSSTQSVEATSCFSCLLLEEGDWNQVPTSNQPSRISRRRIHLATTRSSFGPEGASPASANHQGSARTVERYDSSGCHLGTSYHSAAVSPSQALRTRLFLRGQTC
jgi:hypothetical protein